MTTSDSSGGKIKHPPVRRCASGIHSLFGLFAPIDLSAAAAGDGISAKGATSPTDKKLLPTDRSLPEESRRLRHFVSLRRFQVVLALDTVIGKNVSMRIGLVPIGENTTARANNGFRRAASISTFLRRRAPHEVSPSLFPRTEGRPSGTETAWVTTVP